MTLRVRDTVPDRIPKWPEALATSSSISVARFLDPVWTFAIATDCRKIAARVAAGEKKLHKQYSSCEKL
jgi:hypothetical protein